jgi:DNA polymerase III delta subunit
MTYFFYGDDFKKARESLNAFVEKLAREKPHISVLRIDEDNWSEYSLEGLVGEQGLFEKEILVILDNLFYLKVPADEIIKNLEKLEKSKNIFVIIDSSLDQKTTSLIEKHSTKAEKFSLPKRAEETFSPFFLTGALGERDRRKLWALYYKAVFSGISAEEIHGVMFWQIKAILLAKQSDSKESGLKPFAYQKAKNFSRNYSESELKNLSNKLVQIYHQSRMKGLNLFFELEKFVLKI